MKAFASGLSPWAHLATVGADGAPDVVQVLPCWEGDTLRNGIFDYDLDAFAPGGPDGSPEVSCNQTSRCRL